MARILNTTATTVSVPALPPSFPSFTLLPGLNRSPAGWLPVAQATPALASLFENGTLQAFADDYPLRDEAKDPEDLSRFSPVEAIHLVQLQDFRLTLRKWEAKERARPKVYAAIKSRISEIGTTTVRGHK